MDTHRVGGKTVVDAAASYAAAASSDDSLPLGSPTEPQGEKQNKVFCFYYRVFCFYCKVFYYYYYYYYCY